MCSERGWCELHIPSAKQGCNPPASEEPNLADKWGPEVGLTLAGDEPSPLGLLRAAAPLMRSSVKHKQSLHRTTEEDPEVAAVAVVSAAGGDGDLHQSAGSSQRYSAVSVHVNNINNQEPGVFRLTKATEERAQQPLTVSRRNISRLLELLEKLESHLVYMAA
ncbi:unnamed protein product [Lota lota]